MPLWFSRLKISAKDDGVVSAKVELVGENKFFDWPLLLDIDLLGLGEDEPIAQTKNQVFDASDESYDAWKFSENKVGADTSKSSRI